MKKVYRNLSEKDKRLYAAVEALKLPHGGIRYISELLECDRKTIQRGIKELKNPRIIQKKSIREKGGGRKEKIKSIANIDEIFLGIIKEHTAGDPRLSHKNK
jgi:predicted transcriptional regulator